MIPIPYYIKPKPILIKSWYQQISTPLMILFAMRCDIDTYYRYRHDRLFVEPWYCWFHVIFRSNGSSTNLSVCDSVYQCTKTLIQYDKGVILEAYGCQSYGKGWHCMTSDDMVWHQIVCAIWTIIKRFSVSTNGVILSATQFDSILEW